MPKENNKVDINKHEIDIDTLFKQNVNDLSAIKELYKKLKDMENKISQIKYIDSQLANKLKKEYEKLKNIIFDENIQVKLTNDINDIKEVNTKLTNDIESINSQLDSRASKDEVDIERKRIDSFTKLKEGSTTGDAELIDARIGFDGVIYETLGSGIREQIRNVNSKLNVVGATKKYNNLFVEGEMLDISKFTGSNINKVDNGINVNSTASALILRNNDNFNIKEGIEYLLIVKCNSESDVTVTAQMYNGSYFSRNNLNIKTGDNLLYISVTKLQDIDKSVKLYFNSLSASNITFEHILIIPLIDISRDEAISYYNNNGFFTNDYLIEKSFYNKKETYNREEIENLLDIKKVVEITVYSDVDVSGGLVDGDNIFVGSINNKNAIERALDSIRGIKSQKTIIKCIGDFLSNSFEDMNNNDYYGRSYKSYISFNNVYNTKLVGVGNKKTTIKVYLPDAQGVTYGDYEIVNFDGFNISIENFTLLGKNMRYVVHSDTTTGTDYNFGSEFTLKDCIIKHEQQDSYASKSWASPSAIGIGISDKSIFNIENCVIRGVQSDIVGHDSSKNTEYVFNLKNNIFSMATGTAFNWRLFSTKGECNANYEFIGNSFGDKKINIINSVDGVDFYAIVKGHGNSIRFINNYNYLFSDEYELKRAFNNDIEQNRVVDAYGNYSNGVLYGLALDTVLQNEEVRVLTKGLINIDNLIVKEGETFKSNDWVSAENGELIKSDTPTRWSIFELWGKKYLRIE